MNIPRHVYFLILAMLFFVAGTVYTYIAMQTDLELAASGVVVDGTVIEKRERLSNPSKSLSRREYVVEFGFHSPSGYITDEAEIDQTSWERLQRQSVIRVTYAPDQPGMYRVEGEGATFQLWKVLICVGGVLLNWIIYLRVR